MLYDIKQLLGVSLRYFRMKVIRNSKRLDRLFSSAMLNIVILNVYRADKVLMMRQDIRVRCLYLKTSINALYSLFECYYAITVKFNIQITFEIF